MITANVIHRTFQLRCGEDLGTSFTIDVDDKQYLCTAKHCLRNFCGKSIELFHEQKWKTLDVDFVGYGSKDSDICVLSAKIQLSPTHPLPPTMAGMAIGQDAYFLGFPYGIQIEAGKLNRLFPLPLVKRATVSAVSFEEQKIVLMDGHNNPGFSGGPVVFVKPGSPINELNVAAIISGYRFEPSPVLDEKDKETSLKVHANTGIIISSAIDHALDAIKDNPIGIKIDT
ncbi:MAG: serine protease [Nitrospinae bacterium]|nr:serine protease [Nitrospinota bacterium]